MGSKVSIDLELRGDKLVAKGLDNVGDSADRAGDDFDKMAKDAGFLDKRIGELRGELKGLFVEFNKTGDLDILKKINAGNRDLNKFTRLKKQFAGIFDEVVQDTVKIGVKAGAELGDSIFKQAAQTLAGSKAILIGGLIGLGATLTPFLGGVVASAVLGGAGIGGIIGGVALAAKDPRVEDAAKDLGTQLSQAFQTAGEPFVAPVVKVLDELKPIGTTIAGDLREAFASVAPVFLPLAHGITDLVQVAMPGLAKAMEASKPVIRAIANELPDIGRALSTFLGDMAEHSDEAVMAFITLSKIIQGTIVTTGKLIGALSDAFEFTVRVAGKIAPVLEAIYGWIPILGDTVKNSRRYVDEIIEGLDAAKDQGRDFAGSLDDVADSATQAKNKMMALNDALDKFFGIAMGSSQATIAYERAWDEMIETLTDGKRTLDLSTDAGRENMESINETIGAIQGLHKARVDEGMAVEQSLAIRDRDLEKLRAQLLQLGYNKQKIDEIINLYKLMPDLASTTVEAPGAETTLAQLREMLSLINAIKGGVAAGAAGGVKVGGKRAAGGPVLAGQTYLVGENGPELVTMPGSGYVTNAAQTAAVMSGASGGSMPSMTLNVAPISSGRPLEDVLLDALAYRLRVTGGVIGQFRIPRAA